MPGEFFLKVNWDCDDIFWKQNYEAAVMCGIPFEKLVDFHVSENPILTDAEKVALDACYADPEHFRNIPWCPGIERIPDLVQYGVKNVSNSNSFSEEVRSLKLTQLRARLPRLDEMELQWGLVNGSSTVRKRFDDDADVLVDDSPYNAKIFPGRYIVTPFTPWIITPKAQAMLQGKEVHYFTYGYPDEAIEIVRLLALREADRHHS